MPEYKAKTKFDLGQEVVVAAGIGSKGCVVKDSVAAIMPIFLKDKIDILYILTVDYGNACQSEFSNRAYEERELLSLEDGRKAAADSLRRKADLIEKGEPGMTMAPEKHFAQKG